MRCNCPPENSLGYFPAISAYDIPMARSFSSIRSVASFLPLASRKFRTVSKK